MSSLMGRGDVVRGDPLLPPTSPQETSELIAKMRRRLRGVGGGEVGGLLLAGNSLLPLKNYQRFAGD